MTTSIQTQRNTCPGCGRVNDLATHAGEINAGGPQPGNLSICFQCGHLAMFCDDMSLRELTDEEMHDVAGDPELLRVQRMRKLAYEQMIADREKKR